jgi:tetratricopeptide (TPR) repeat protein
MLIPLTVALAGCATTGDERWRLFNEDGVEQFAKGNYRDALESFDYAMTFHPQDPVLIYNSAQCYDRLGDFKKAEQLYAYCVQLDARHGDARLALINVKYRTGRAAEVNQTIEDWLKQSPPSADAFVADAWRLRQERAYPSAQGRLQQAMAIEPNNRRALTELAILNEIQNMPERSLVLYERILAQDKYQPAIAEKVEKLRAKGVKRAMPN